ncbi:MAG: hypothetical protein HXS54_10525 [Theionarchaea archaeon]|nr:hypothetical protein [Theionarchaea archaeon]
MIYGVDIGGVHIKITSLDQTHDPPKAKSAFFPFKGKAEMIEKLISLVSHPDLVVITQTLSASRNFCSSAEEGTHHIVDLTERLFTGKVRYVGLSYRLYTPEQAKEHYLDVACRNWVATCYITHYLNLFEEGLVIDCGTNSTDIVPIIDSVPITLDDNDRGYTRLATGEIFWSGLYFTHVQSLSPTLVMDGREFQVKPTVRSLVSDAFVVLGRISPEDVFVKTSYESSVVKILDTICADKDLLSFDDAKKIAQFFVDKQREKTEAAIRKVLTAANKKYETDLKVAAIAGAGKEIILREVLKNMDFEEIIDIEKAASEVLDLETSLSNCETSLGCALMGLQVIQGNTE